MGVNRKRSTKMAPLSLSISYFTCDPCGISITTLMSCGTSLPGESLETSMVRPAAVLRAGGIAARPAMCQMGGPPTRL